MGVGVRRVAVGVGVGVAVGAAVGVAARVVARVKHLLLELWHADVTLVPSHKPRPPWLLTRTAPFARSNTAATRRRCR